MAELLISVLVTEIVKNLNELLLREYGIARGLKKAFETLKSTLSIIQAVLKEAEAQQVKSDALRHWLKKLKDAAYDAENIVDEFTVETLRSQAAFQNQKMKRVRKFFSNSNPIASNLQMGHKVKEITDELDTIAAERSKFLLREGDLETWVDDEERAVTDSLVIESEIYGRECDKEKIVELMITVASSEDGVSVVPIVGMGGLGKTTLAQLAFSDERIKKHFEPRIWICVSDNFNMRRIMEAIIESVCGSASGLIEPDPLQRRLQETLSTKRFLLVLDDVWNEDQEKWDRLKNMLRCGGDGSTIIVTTRVEKVASIARTLPIYHLPCLSDDDCWSLFKQRAFDLGRKEEHPNLVAIGKEIVKKCGGVPLAAKALGSLLRFKSEEREWLFIKESEIWDISEGENAILPALRLSYYHLPSHLRQCFAYCSIFPKDYDIEKEKLIHLWIANGFVPSKGRMELEDVGHEIFIDLVFRSFFQNIEKDEDGNITKCKMHDLVHDLAYSIMVNDCSVLLADRDGNIPEKIRHFSYDRESIIPTGLYKAQTLHTFLLLYDYRRGVIEVPQDVTKLKYLRVLELTYVNVRELTPSIGNLRLLRYLNLSCSDVESLPESITSLQNLQMLNLSECHFLYKLPKDLRKMRNLRHIDNSYNTSLTCMPAKVGQLSHLQTLNTFIVGKKSGCRIGELKELNVRGELNIQHIECVRNAKDAEEAKLTSKSNLCSLGLSWKQDGDDRTQDNLEEIIDGLQPHLNLKQLRIDNYQGIRFPHWMRGSVLPNLAKVSLHNCKRSEDLPQLGLLPSLKYLRVHGMNVMKCINTDFYGDSNTAEGFPSLKELDFCDMLNWEEWSGIEGRELFLRLEKLKIENCLKLMTLPCFPSLQDLKLTGCNPMILTSLSRLTSLSSIYISEFSALVSFPEGMLHNFAVLTKLYIGSLPKLQFLHRVLDGLVALKSLEIVSCKELTSLPEGLQNLTSLEKMEISICDSLTSLPEEGMQGLISLQDLSINSCGNLASLSGLQHLTALESLAITGCKEIVALPDKIQNLSALRVLEIWNLSKLISLPVGLQKLTSLQELKIGGCKSLTGLPEWVGSLVSLRSLTIWWCPNVVSLPVGLKNLPTLKRLEIEDCPQLK